MYWKYIHNLGIFVVSSFSINRQNDRKLSFFPKKMTQMIGIDFEQPKTRYSVANISITIELFSLKIQVMNLNVPVYWFNNRYLYKDKQEQEKLYIGFVNWLIIWTKKYTYYIRIQIPIFFFAFQLLYGVILKPCGPIFGHFWPLLPPCGLTWTFEWPPY